MGTFDPIFSQRNLTTFLKVFVQQKVQSSQSTN